LRRSNPKSNPAEEGSRTRRGSNRNPNLSLASSPHPKLFEHQGWISFSDSGCFPLRLRIRSGTRSYAFALTRSGCSFNSGMSPSFGAVKGDGPPQIFSRLRRIPAGEKIQDPQKRYAFRSMRPNFLAEMEAKVCQRWLTTLGRSAMKRRRSFSEAPASHPRPSSRPRQDFWIGDCHPFEPTLAQLSPFAP